MPVREEYFENEGTDVELETKVSPPPDELEPWERIVHFGC